MSIARKTALGLFLAGVMTIAAAPAGAGSLPANLATVKAAAPTDVAHARWVGRWGWRGGGWGWHRGWGFPGAFVGGLALGAAAAAYPYYGYAYPPSYYNSYNYYLPAYADCDPYCGGGYGYYGGPYYGGYRAAYWGGGWGYRRWGWRGW